MISHKPQSVILPLDIVFKTTLPSLIPRYDREVSNCVGPRTDFVAPNTRLPTRSEHIDGGWVAFTNPEGDCYSLHKERHILTYSNIRVPSTRQKLISAHNCLVELGRAKDPQIAEREVYIHILTETPTSTQAEYYFMDSSAMHPFWVHGVRMQDLGLSGFESTDHLQATLIPEFWTHIEYFAVHRKLEKSWENELIAIFRHGCTDDMTSFGSTFPYGAQECREHLQTLEGFIASGDYSGYRTATFARLWASITRVRQINGYGLPGPRLDRNQGLVEFQKSQQPTVILRILDALFLRLPRSKFDRITELWNGRVVFQRHWHVYFDEQRSEWLRVAVLSSALFIVGTGIIVVDGPKPLVVASASLASASVISALSLHESHSRSRFNTASDISSWIMSVESFRSGLLPIAVKFTLPQITALYSAFFLLFALLTLINQRAANPALLSLASLGPATVAIIISAFL
ncbi:hypothetical protein M407DRAFT_20359 [Tulasnella calospora MUT 4182]|uniref:WW domain-containing protein n=1 Tax=Tulasnella calospora MUT 4182 TaxID=1051891 RepID=A0A0C3QRY1_9AGAM|nr:hypothetical protein M407DRAFT_20359 [Tulasnella calospora MUT 4182]